MSRDQRFYWTEPLAFASARARTSQGGGRVLLFFMFALLFSVALLAISVPDDARGFTALVGISLAAAVLIAFPGTWLFSRLPNSVLVASDRISIGRTVIPVAQVKSAVVGTTKIENTEYPVLTFRTATGQNYIFGLGRKIDAVALAAFLHQHGVREPQA